MADKGIVLDAKALRRLVEDYGDGVIRAQDTGLARAMNILEAMAVELAPVDIGNLEASTVIRFELKGKGVTGRLSFVTPYAARIHELPDDARGPKTQAKAGNELGKAGPKYLERPLRQMQKDLPKIIAQEMKEKTQ